MYYLVGVLCTGGVGASLSVTPSSLLLLLLSGVPTLSWAPLLPSESVPDPASRSSWNSSVI